jgi:ribosomal protein S18 acetylase RimI-like enzyme
MFATRRRAETSAASDRRIHTGLVDFDANDTRPGPVVSLRPMNASEFGPWIEHGTRVFAAEQAQATGMPFEVSLAKARAQLPELLPQGLATKGMWFLIVVDAEGSDVGSLWLGMDPDRTDTVFVWAVEIDEEYRRNGMGRAAMTSAEAFTREVGAAAISLHVFGSNTTARSLYESLGYEATSVQMIKRLPPE